MGWQMDLELDTVRTVGRAAKPMQVEMVRELRSEDLALLALERGIKAPSIKKLRDSHHAVARCIAEGKPNTDTMLITGYSASRISILKSDPAFMELVEFYKKNVEETREALTTDGFSKAAAIRNDLMEEYHDRLLDEPERFDIQDLESGIKTFSDRSGLGPQSKSTNVNVNVDLAARVSAGRARVERLSARSSHALPALAEGEPSGRTPAPPLAPQTIEGECREVKDE